MRTPALLTTLTGTLLTLSSAQDTTTLTNTVMHPVTVIATMSPAPSSSLSSLSFDTTNATGSMTAFSGTVTPTISSVLASNTAAVSSAASKLSSAIASASASAAGATDVYVPGVGVAGVGMLLGAFALL